MSVDIDRIDPLLRYKVLTQDGKFKIVKRRKSSMHRFEAMGLAAEALPPGNSLYSCEDMIYGGYRTDPGNEMTSEVIRQNLEAYPKLKTALKIITDERMYAQSLSIINDMPDAKWYDEASEIDPIKRYKIVTLDGKFKNVKRHRSTMQGFVDMGLAAEAYPAGGCCEDLIYGGFIADPDDANVADCLRAYPTLKKVYAFVRRIQLQPSEI
jgi:hypothetical protein